MRLSLSLVYFAVCVCVFVNKSVRMCFVAINRLMPRCTHQNTLSNWVNTNDAIDIVYDNNDMLLGRFLAISVNISLSRHFDVSMWDTTQPLVDDHFRMHFPHIYQNLKWNCIKWILAKYTICLSFNRALIISWLFKYAQCTLHMHISQILNASLFYRFSIFWG